MLRSFFVGLSENRTIRGFAERSAVGQKLSSRFVAGTSIQDAVAAANRLAEPLTAGKVTAADLQAIERRRASAARLTQAVQLAVQNRIISRALQAARTPRAPLLLKLFDKVALLRRIPARLIAIGFRPEHIATAEQLAGRDSHWVA